MDEYLVRKIGIIVLTFLLGFVAGFGADKLITYLQEKEFNRRRKYYIVQFLYAGYISLVAFKYGLSVQALKLAVYGFALVVTGFTDFESKYIFIQVNIAAGIIGVILNILSINLISQYKYNISLDNMIAGALLGFVPVFLLSLFGAMGEGDAWFLGMIGLFMGWRLTLIVLFISVVGGGIASVFLVVFKRYGRKTEIAFGPFIAVAGVIVSLLGKEIWLWYMNFVGM